MPSHSSWLGRQNGWPDKTRTTLWLHRETRATIPSSPTVATHSHQGKLHPSAGPIICLTAPAIGQTHQHLRANSNLSSTSFSSILQGSGSITFLMPKEGSLPSRLNKQHTFLLMCVLLLPCSLLLWCLTSETS